MMSRSMGAFAIGAMLFAAACDPALVQTAANDEGLESATDTDVSTVSVRTDSDNRSNNRDTSLAAQRPPRDQLAGQPGSGSAEIVDGNLEGNTESPAPTITDAEVPELPEGINPDGTEGGSGTEETSATDEGATDTPENSGNEETGSEAPETTDADTGSTEEVDGGATDSDSDETEEVASGDLRLTKIHRSA